MAPKRIRETSEMPLDLNMFVFQVLCLYQKVHDFSLNRHTIVLL